MTIKLFIIGRPGCGKSEAARYIISCAKTIGLSTFRINDYDILQEMFQTDQEHMYFRPLTYASEGHDFDVIDFKVLDKSLQELEKRVSDTINTAKITVVEFARNGYKEAFKLFKPIFLQNAYFLFIETEVSLCVSRIHERASHPKTSDDIYVSDRIMHLHYDQDGKSYITTDFALDCAIPSERITVLFNAGSLQDFKHQIFSYIYTIFSREEQLLPDTDPTQFVPTFIHDYNLQCE